MARGWSVVAICRAPSFTRITVHRAPNMIVVEVPGFGIRAGVIVYLATGGILGILLGRRAAFLAMQLASETLVGGLCARVHRRPFIALSTASGELSEVREALGSPFRVVHRANLRRASFLVGQTSAAAAELRAFAPPERIAVIHNPLPEMGGHGHDGEPNAVFTGRLEKYKDLGVLLEAWEAVVTRIPAARLILVGAGGEYRSVEPALKRTVAERPGLRRSVTFTGWVSDVEEYLRGADVYVLPSRSEGMSNALLEACAARRIIVASDMFPTARCSARTTRCYSRPEIRHRSHRRLCAPSMTTKPAPKRSQPSIAGSVNCRLSLQPPESRT